MVKGGEAEPRRAEKHPEIGILGYPAPELAALDSFFKFQLRPLAARAASKLALQLMFAPALQFSGSKEP